MAAYPTTAKDLSRYVVDFCADDHPISNLQLQKILYFLQAYYCKATRGSLLFEDEFEAWAYGPVLRKVYTEYARYGGDVIRYKNKDFVPPPDEILSFINDGIRDLRSRAPWDLVRWSHANGSPWSEVYRNGQYNTIPNQLIRDTYGSE